MKFVLPISLVFSISVFLLVYRAEALKNSPSSPAVSGPSIGMFAPSQVKKSADNSRADASRDSDADTHEIIRAAAAKHGVPAAFVKSIVAAESNFDPTVVSPKGAVGLMQLMPQTAQQFGADPNVPEQNVDAGTRYLKILIEKYRGSRNWLSRVIAAYNAGPTVVDRYHGVPPFHETRTYVTRVLNYLKEFRKDPTLAVGGLRLPRQ
jgi:soluble lytic murein transglycosylase-like protein